MTTNLDLNRILIKGQVIRATFSFNLSRNNVAIATNFHAAKSRNTVYFLQHENLLRPEVVIRETFFFQLVVQQCCIASCDCLLSVLPPTRTTNFHVEESRNSVSTYNATLLRDKLKEKCCPYYLAFKLGWSFVDCPK